jgi:hypothetical protein
MGVISTLVRLKGEQDTRAKEGALGVIRLAFENQDKLTTEGLEWVQQSLNTLLGDTFGAGAGAGGGRGRGGARGSGSAAGRDSGGFFKQLAGSLTNLNPFTASRGTKQEVQQIQASKPQKMFLTPEERQQVTANQEIAKHQEELRYQEQLKKQEGLIELGNQDKQWHATLDREIAAGRTPEQAKDIADQALGIKPAGTESSTERLVFDGPNGEQLVLFRDPKTGKMYNLANRETQVPDGYKLKSAQPQDPAAIRLLTEAHGILDDKTGKYTQQQKEAAADIIKDEQNKQRGSSLRIEVAQQDINAQNAPPQPIKPGSREYRVGQDLAYGRLRMTDFNMLIRTMGRNATQINNKKMDIYDLASELNPNFNIARFEMGYQLASNPRVQQQLASLDNVKMGVADLLTASDKASRVGATILNKAIIPGGISVGGKAYSNFATARTAFADELSGALGYGSATDMSRQMGFDMTNPNLSPENFRSAVQDIVIPFVDRKKQSLLTQMGPYGESGMNPAADVSAGLPRPDVQGKRISTDQAEQYIRAYGGDRKKAEEAAKKAGWSF